MTGTNEVINIATIYATKDTVNEKVVQCRIKEKWGHTKVFTMVFVQGLMPKVTSIAQTVQRLEQLKALVMC